MTVSAATVTSAASPAMPRLVPLRPPASPVSAGTYPHITTDFVSGWHVHDEHQIEYASEGAVQVQTATARYLTPPQQAVWIPAGLPHNTILRKVRTVSLFFDRELISGMADQARVLRVEPVFREMILFGARWPIDRTCEDALAVSYFTTLAGLVERWLENESPFYLPVSEDPVVAAAMRFTDDHLGTATVERVAVAVAVSERTLRRRFATVAGMTWRTYLRRSRLIRAMALLDDPKRTVLSVAAEVGFDNAGAFARAFTDYTGQSPSRYRHSSSGHRGA
ncbi:helix-turn-helix domain-containing protein [Actinomadura sp. LD22]|uniref:Helix-turn-helix domain-containing protein n=1 Tax=Actinomadura physcomitrii TaxID=2650748 RepID=A0A6I4M1P8_9ACTN|nr:helix-turn-helix transcriptional regulator [Actinomadura physcomitrii]MVZ99867.1 helix-turn-helix domain-containing protein [Actinomadura physcomitrii]